LNFVTPFSCMMFQTEGNCFI